jgi:hypothetical protein
LEKPSPQQELETLVGALIAQLYQNGSLHGDDIEAIARRLDQSGMPDMADEVRAVPVSDALAAPESLRYGFEVIDGGRDGGNEPA